MNILLAIMVAITFSIAANDEPACPEHHYPVIDSYTYQTTCKAQSKIVWE